MGFRGCTSGNVDQGEEEQQATTDENQIGGQQETREVPSFVICCGLLLFFSFCSTLGMSPQGHAQGQVAS